VFVSHVCVVTMDKCEKTRIYVSASDIPSKLLLACGDGEYCDKDDF